MAFFKKQQQPINGLWYPQSVTVGKPVTTDQIAAKLAFVSTVTQHNTKSESLQGLSRTRNEK